MTALPRRFCPECKKSLEDRQLIHGLYGEHIECYDARIADGRQPNYEVKDKQWKPMPDKLTGVGATGWLAPDGKFYGCRPYVHIRLGDALAEYFMVVKREDWSRSSQDLEKEGWAHVGTHGVYWRTDDRNRSATQAQRDVLWDWFVEIKDLLKESDRDQSTFLWTMKRLFREEDE